VGKTVIRLIKGKAIVPIGSAWASGFNVRRPRDRGVGSPIWSAARAWQNSWKVIAIIREMNEIILKIKLSIFQKKGWLWYYTLLWEHAVYVVRGLKSVVSDPMPKIEPQELTKLTFKKLLWQWVKIKLVVFFALSV